MKAIETRFDGLVADSGQPNKEVVDSRGGHKLLGDRLNLVDVNKTNILLGENTLSHNSKVNGFSQIGVKGQTLVNVLGKTNFPNGNFSKPNIPINFNGGKYTVMAFGDLLQTDVRLNIGGFKDDTHIDNLQLIQKELNKPTLVTVSYVNQEVNNVRFRDRSSAVGTQVSYVVLEGDHTSKPISYFEGLKSVAQPTNKIEVLSVGENFASLDLKEKLMDIRNYGSPDVNGYLTYKVKMPSKNTKYSVSIQFDKLDKIGTGASYLLTDLGTAFFYLNQGQPYNITEVVTSDNEGFITFRSANRDYNGVVNIMNVSIIKSTTPKPYKPYISNKTSLLLNAPLRKIDDVVCDEIKGNEVIRKCEEFTLNGSENVALWNIESIDTIGFMITKYHNNTNSPLKSICNLFKTYGNASSLNGANGEGFATNSGNLYFKILKSKLPIQDVQGFKTWLSQNNVTVVYELATPIIEPINNPSIPYFEGGHIFTDGGAIPTPISIEVGDTLKSQVDSLFNKLVELMKEGAEVKHPITTLPLEPELDTPTTLPQPILPIHPPTTLPAE